MVTTNTEHATESQSQRGRDAHGVSKQPRRLNDGATKGATLLPRNLPDPAPTQQRPALVVTYSIPRLLADANSILGRELARLHTASGAGLSLEQSRQLANYVRALLDIAKEERAQLALGKLEQLTDEQLLDAMLESDDLLQALLARAATNPEIRAKLGSAK